MKKSEARKFYRELRKGFSKEEVHKMSENIFMNIKKLQLLNAEYFHLFLPIEKHNEINTYPIIDWLFQENKKVVLPFVVGDDMINCQVEKGFKTTLNSLQIPEPIDYTEIDSQLIDIVFLPMFVADKKGNRVGYGGGYYDRFLSKCKPETKKIGLSYFKPIDYIDDVYGGDIPLDYLLTPDTIVSF